MSNYKVEFSDRAKKDIQKFINAGDTIAVKKIYNLVEELYDHPRTGTGHPEQLKGYDGNRWSRRISQKHRLVYDIIDDIVVVLVLTAYGHYE